MSLKVGDKAPGFKLFNSAKQEVNLEDYKGKKVVLLFFPLAFTGVCTTELCSVRDDIDTYQQLDAEILAVSVDSPFVLEKFKEEQRLNFMLLSDFNADSANAYGALHNEFAFGMRNVAKRSAFVIDEKGSLRYTEVLDVPTELPNFAAIKETLASMN